MDGYFSVRRKLLKSTLWLSEPFTRGQAWVDLIGLANHTGGYLRVRGVKVNMKRGQVGWSQLKLAERWRWSRGKVKRFLNELENDKRIVQRTIQQNMRLTSLITLINYHQYQTDGTANGQQTDIKRTSNGHQTDIKQYSNNKDNKENKENKENNTTMTDIEKFCSDFILYIKETKPKYAPRSVNTFKNSYTIINRLIAIDGFPFKEIQSTMQWAVKDNFWQDNIYSLGALRNKSGNGLTKFQNISNSMAKEAKRKGHKKSDQGIAAAKSFMERMKEIRDQK